MENYTLQVFLSFVAIVVADLICDLILGYGAGGRLGIGGTDSVLTPTLVESLQHVFITEV